MKRNSKLYLNPCVFLLNAKYAKQHYQGSSRWVVVNTKTKEMLGAIGKDEYPQVIDIMCNASRSKGISYDKKLTSLVSAGILSSEKTLGPPNIDYLTFYQQYVSNYPFNDYRSPDRWQRDQEHMAEYGKLGEPPPVYSDWSGENYSTFPLPEPKFRTKESVRRSTNISGIDKLSTLLAACFQATGSIDGGDFGPWLRKTSPSGGARHPAECLVTIENLPPLGSGVFIYDADNHALVRQRDFVVVEVSARQRIQLTFAARVERPMWRYRESRSLRPVVIDVGHVIQTAKEFCSTLSAVLIQVETAQEFLNEPSMRYMHLATFELLHGSYDSGKLENICIKALHSNSPPNDFNSTTEFKTNPYLWLAIENGDLFAVTQFPVIRMTKIDRDGFLLLNHCQPSARGDRPATIANLQQLVGPEAAKQSLPMAFIDGGFLLERKHAESLMAGLAAWVSKGWYLNALAYVAFTRDRQGVGTAGCECGHIFERSFEECWTTLSTQRKTTRLFSSQTLDSHALEGFVSILGRASPIVGGIVQVNFTARNVVGVEPNSHYHYDGENRRFISSTIKVDSELLQNAAIGQTAVQTAAVALWLSTHLDGSRPAEYFSRLLALGEIGQQLCMHAAKVGVGIFVTPAVKDAVANSICEFPVDANVAHYFVALGVPQHVTASSDAANLAIEIAMQGNYIHFQDTRESELTMLIDKESGKIQFSRATHGA